MKKNITEKQSQIRTIIAIALLLIALLFVENSAIKIILALLSAILAITSFIRFCPMKNFVKGNAQEEILREQENEPTETEKETSQKEPEDEPDETKENESAEEDNSNDEAGTETDDDSE